jgi:hypothetical protein
LAISQRQSWTAPDLAKQVIVSEHTHIPEGGSAVVFEIAKHLFDYFLPSDLSVFHIFPTFCLVFRVLDIPERFKQSHLDQDASTRPLCLPLVVILEALSEIHQGQHGRFGHVDSMQNRS